MTPTARAEAVHECLWPGGAAASSTWAVLDGARDARIYPALQVSRLDPLCLYSGALPARLQQAAPYLIEIHPGHAFTWRLLDEGWGRSWGIFLRVREPDMLRPHLRRLLRVEDETGRRLVFRFYDPRVLRRYLPTCTGEEVKQVFGPISHLLLEDGDGAAALQFSFDRRGLQRLRVPLSRAAAAAPG